MNDVTLPGALMQAIGGYLVERPYREVAPLLDGIRLAMAGRAPAAPDPNAAPPALAPAPPA